MEIFQPPLNHILFLDIETVAITPDFNQLDERMQKVWVAKTRNLRDSDEYTPEELWARKAAIYAEFGKVICIGLGVIRMVDDEWQLRVTQLSNDDENELLTDFSNLVREKFNQDKLYLCAHNGKEFDFPYLCRRMIVNGVAIPDVLNLAGKKPWEVQHLDTMDYWKFGDRKNYTSLETLSAVFSMPSSKSNLDGSKVHSAYYENNDLEAISNYCMQDVEVMMHIYLKLIGKTDISTIQYV
ncbi:3'-5' exonuclease [Marinigracilibium pacificum]|uniref:3'-5' exonuclease n=1 Tax=Marinigracilibium pacificum TaxID=2729599 RepID=A0A848J2M3_9BACT|nr:3'-5' exonuclease [Marinigracilibium pacificum]NMM49755.1 3'-5' exonuclease [Marinigracilibium pacificum]